MLDKINVGEFEFHATGHLDDPWVEIKYSYEEYREPQ